MEAIDHEQQEREAGFDAVRAFTQGLGLDDMSLSEKVTWLKEVRFEQFMNLLCRVNGKMTNVDLRQKWTGESVKSVVGMGSADVVDLDPPEEAHKEFEKLFDQMQAEISEENLDKWAVKIYFGIIFAHMFPDGNGRLSRFAYTTMRCDGVPDESISTRKEKVGTISIIINLSATAALFKSRGVECDQKAHKDFGLEQYLFYAEDGMPDPSYSGYLRYLAAREVLGVGDDMIRHDQIPQERIPEFEARYNELKQAWYWEVQSVCDEDEKLSGVLDEILFSQNESVSSNPLWEIIRKIRAAFVRR